MKDEKKKERLAELFGLALPEAPKPPTPDDEAASRAADATLVYFQTPEFFREVDCKRCGHKFAVNMASVAYCSDDCRKHSLADIGIEWDPTKKPQERWGRHVPLVVPPQALELVQEAMQTAQQAEEVAVVGE